MSIRGKRRTVWRQTGRFGRSRVHACRGLVGRDTDRLFSQALDETAADRRVFGQQGGGAITLLDLHDLPVCTENLIRGHPVKESAKLAP